MASELSRLIEDELKNKGYYHEDDDREPDVPEDVEAPQAEDETRALIGALRVEARVKEQNAQKHLLGLKRALCIGGGLAIVVTVWIVLVVKSSGGGSTIPKAAFPPGYSPASYQPSQQSVNPSPQSQLSAQPPPQPSHPPPSHPPPNHPPPSPVSSPQPAPTQSPMPAPTQTQPLPPPPQPPLPASSPPHAPPPAATPTAASPPPAANTSQAGMPPPVPTASPVPSPTKLAPPAGNTTVSPSPTPSGKPGNGTKAISEEDYDSNQVDAGYAPPPPSYIKNSTTGSDVKAYEDYAALSPEGDTASTGR